MKAKEVKQLKNDLAVYEAKINMRTKTLSISEEKLKSLQANKRLVKKLGILPVKRIQFKLF